MSRFPIKTESIEVCKSTMKLNSAAVRGGSFAQTRQRLTAALAPYKLKLGELADCAH